jgi:hypothetical protein
MEVGQNIFIKTVGNRARHGGSKIIDTTITKLGRKYFQVEALPRTKFEIETMQEVTNYSVDHIAYESRVAIEEELEKTALTDEIRNAFKFYGKPVHTLEQLRKIKAVLCDG